MMSETVIELKNQNGSDLKAAAEQKRGAYAYEEAAVLYTAALGKPGLPPRDQYELLSGRAECYRFLGNRKAESADLGRMGDLAEELGDISLQIQASNRLALTLNGMGDLAQARNLAERNLEIARQQGDRLIEAQSMTTLAFVFGTLGEYKETIAMNTQALNLFQDLDNPSGQARSLASISQMNFRLGNLDQVQTNANQALDLYRRLGDREGEAYVLNTLGISNPDLAQQRYYLEQSAEILETIQLKERLGVAYNNLGLLYQNLGLKSTALDYINKAVQIHRAGQDRLALGYTLESLAGLHLYADSEDGSSLSELIELSRELGEPFTSAYIHFNRGRSEVIRECPDQALMDLQTAVQEMGDLGNPLQADAYAWLGAAYLQLGKIQAARRATAQAAQLFQANPNVSGSEAPAQELWWWRYKALTNGKGPSKTALKALKKAYELMMEGISRLSDDGLKRSYLNKIEINRQILREWVSNTTQWELPSDGRTSAAGDLRAQFQRLLKIGVRMNGQRQLAELYDFILQQVVELSGAERAFIGALNPNGAMDILAAFGYSDGEIGEARDQARDLVQEVNLRQRPVLRGGVDPSDLGSKSTVSLEALSVICAPLLSAGTLSGLIYVENHDLYGPFGQTDLDLLAAFANQAAAAIENARLYQGLEQRVAERTNELQTANSNLEQRNAELAIINSLGEAMAKNLDVPTVTHVVGEKLREIFSAEMVDILLFNPQSKIVEPKYIFCGKLYDARLEPPFPLGEGLTSQVILSRRPLLLNSAAELKYHGASTYATAPVGEKESESYMGVPITVGDRVIGVVDVQSYLPNAFNEDNIHLLSILSTNMGVAIENARLFDETNRLLDVTQQRNAELGVINSIQQGLASKLDMQGIYELVGQRIYEIFDAQVVLIVKFERQNNLSNFVYAIEMGERLYSEPRETSGFSGYIKKTGQSLVINENIVERAKELDSPIIAGEPPKSWMGVPLRMGDEIRGVISLQNITEENAFSESDLRLLETLASSMSVALENARLFDEIQTRNREVSEALERQTVTSEVLRIIASSPNDVQPVLDAIAESAVRLSGTDDAVVAITDGIRLKVASHYGSIPALYPEEGIPYNRESVSGRAMIERRPLQVGDLTLEQAAEYVTGQAMARKYGYRMTFAVPLIREGTAIGCIMIRKIDAGLLSEKQIELLQTFADQAVIAIENVRLFKEIQRLLEETQQRNAELAVINSVGQGLVKELNFQAIIDLVGDKVSQIFDAQEMSIRLYDPPTNTIQFPYIIERGERIKIDPRPAGKGFAGHILKTRRPLVIHTLEEMEKLTIEFEGFTVPGTMDTISFVGVPILAGEKAIGVIVLESVEENSYSESDVSLLSTLAANLGVALQNARLFEETRRLLAESEQRTAELTIISGVSQALVQHLDFQAIIDLVGDEVRKVFGGQETYIALYDARTNLSRLPYWVDADGDRVPFPGDDRAPQGLTARIIQTRQPLVLNTYDEVVEQGAIIIDDGKPVTHSFMGVPILVGDAVIGVTAVQDYPQSRYSQSDLRLLQTLASALGVALENARLFEETRRLLDETQQRNAELAVINSVQQGLVSSLDYQGIIDLVGDTLRELFHTGDIGVRIYDSKKDQIQYLYEFEHGKRLYVDPMQLGGVSKRIIESRKPVVVNERMAEFMQELGALTIPGTDQAKSFMGVPIISGNVAVGLILLEDHERENAFSESAVRLLTTLAASLSVALENARLFDETKRLLAETEQRAAELAIINSVGQALASQLEVQAVFDLVGDQIREIFDAQVVALVTYDKRTNFMHYPYLIEQGERLEVEDEPLDEMGFGPHIIHTRQPLMFNRDMVKHSAEFGSYTLAGEPPKSYLGVPLIIGEEARGVISLQNVEKEDAFDESDLHLLTTLASSLSVALENARLFEETRRLLDETQQRNAELAVINSVQQGLVSNLEFQGIIDLVGDTLREVFKTGDMGIRQYDAKANLVHYVYQYEHGKRFEIESEQPRGFTRLIIDTRQPVLVNRDLLGYAEKIGSKVFPGTDIAKSLIAVPIITGEAVSGLIMLENYEREEAFSESDLRLLTTLSASLSVALENARLFEETRRLLEETQQHNQELAVINQVGQSLAAQLDPQRIYEFIGETLSDVFNAQVIQIISYDRHADLAYYPYQIEKGVRLHSSPIQPVGFSAQILKTRRALLVNEELEDKLVELGGKVVVGESPKSYLGVPLIAGGEAIGAISLQDIDRENAFKASDQRLLSTLALNVGVALENARLYQETQRRGDQMASIAEIGREVSATLDLQTVLQGLSGHVHQLFEARDTVLRLADEAGTTFHPIVALGKYSDQNIRSDVYLGEGVTGSIALTGIAEVIDDLGNDPRAIHVAGTPEVEEIPDTMMCVPLIARGRTIGILSVYRDRPEGLFTPVDLNFLVGLTRQAAIAIENARLYTEIQSQKQYFESLVQISPVAIITVDLDFKVVSWNPGAEALFGYTEEEAVGKTIYDLHSRRDYIRDESTQYGEEIKTGKRIRAISQRTRKDGSLVDVELFGVPVVVDDQQMGNILIYHDITDLVAARKEAESANQAKSAFLATMSHEIRTPMNGVIGMASLLLDTQLSNDQREYAEIIRDSGDALLAIINDILDFSKIEAGKMELDEQPFNLRECVEGTLDLVATRAIDKGLEISLLVEEDVPYSIVGDVNRLRQILLNLLSNAVKFTDQGEVVINVSSSPVSSVKWGTGESDLRPDIEKREAESRDKVNIRFSVHDTGIGIPADRMDRLFQSFSQVDASTARKYGGTGLGLAISKRLTEMMGGQMWAESEGVTGNGATFYFTIQVEALPVSLRDRPKLQGIQPLFNGKRVLIVDDNDTNRRILVLQTRGWGMIPRDTPSPHTALKWIEEGDPFDLAILDMHMPEIDGLELAAEIRKVCSQAELPLILCTSLGRRESGADELGFAGYLSKPVKPSQLYDVLASVLAGDSEAESKEPAVKAQFDPGMAERHPLDILLAEDNLVNQKLALRLLQQMGYDAYVVSNGLEVLDALDAHRYDVVLMDVQMPEMDGLEATRQVHTRLPKPERPYIIAMTANAMQGDREMCLQAGMNDYVSKPVRADELVEALGRARPIRARNP